MNISEFIYTVMLNPAPLRRAANALIKAMLPQTVSVGGSVIWLNPDDPVVSGGLSLGVYEKAEIAFFRRHFRKDMTFIDVGANVGLYTALAMATPDFRGKIIAVEPQVAGATALLRNSPNCILMTEFWPRGIINCGRHPLDYVASLLRLGFCLHELQGPVPTLVPVESCEDWVRRNPGRHYANLIGLKGEFAGIALERA